MTNKRCVSLPRPYYTAYLDDASTGHQEPIPAWDRSLLMCVRLALKGLPLGAPKCHFLLHELNLLGMRLNLTSFTCGPKALKRLFAVKLPRSIRDL